MTLNKKMILYDLEDSVNYPNDLKNLNVSTSILNRTLVLFASSKMRIYQWWYKYLYSYISISYGTRFYHETRTPNTRVPTWICVRFDHPHVAPLRDLYYHSSHKKCQVLLWGYLLNAYWAWFWLVMNWFKLSLSYL